MFLNDNFLLENESGKQLFHDFAKDEPIFDYHCHLSPQEILANQPYRNITHIWLGGDHYKWRLMRANGISEDLITGDTPDYDKFLAFAQTLEKACGNPIYEWTHLELKRFFKIDDILNEKSAPAIWKKCNALLATEDFLPRNLIANMQVRALCTTDDPIDDLSAHEQLAKEEERFKVLPTFRPDKVMQIEKVSFSDYIKQLGAVTGGTILSLDNLKAALAARIIFFKAHGGLLSDHALPAFPKKEVVSRAALEVIFQKGLKQETLGEKEIASYHYHILLVLNQLYVENDFVAQWHLNSIRDLNTPMYQKLGPDTGFDAIGNAELMAERIAVFLDDLPKMPTSIWYSLNPNDWLSLLTVLGGFQNGTGVQKHHFGSGWWFDDTYSGMRKQLTDLSEQGLLGNFIGMLTDSRSFLSYPRHEYFRRVLCSLIGSWVEAGRVPFEMASQTVQKISYQNANDLFS
ncbi:glucuronate isomerase [Pseudolactococcus yaeyamensis]